MKKVYYQLKMNQVSPLRIGNGENDATEEFRLSREAV